MEIITEKKECHTIMGLELSEEDIKILSEFAREKIINDIPALIEYAVTTILDDFVKNDKEKSE